MGYVEIRGKNEFGMVTNGLVKNWSTSTVDGSSRRVLF